MAWLLVLAFLLRPGEHALPRISHARPLEYPARDLPTLSVKGVNR